MKIIILIYKIKRKHRYKGILMSNISLTHTSTGGEPEFRFPPPRDPEEPGMPYEGFSDPLLSEENLTPGQLVPLLRKYTVHDIKKETLDSMKSLLLKAISRTCIRIMEHHRQMLKRQNKMFEERMTQIAAGPRRKK